MENGDVNQNTINIKVKFGGNLIPISNLAPDSTIKELKSLLQPLTDVLPRGQKLICKGKLLVDDMTLRASEVTDGSRIMLMASQGLHQGWNLFLVETERLFCLTIKSTKYNLQDGLFELFVSKYYWAGLILKQAQDGPISRADNASKMAKEKMEVSVKDRSERWKATGVIALAECSLKAIPEEVWTFGTSARVLDLNNNVIQEIPAQISNLSSLQKLLVNANNIIYEAISWEGVTSLNYLTVLSLNQNQLTSLPSLMSGLTSLRQLHVANNKLTSLPSEVGLLTQLEILKVNGNRISAVPESIGDCKALTEIDLSSNLLSSLPDSLGNIHNLKSLHLSNNGLKSLPSTLFKNCLQLTTLDLHRTEITMDVLRQIDGWESFDKRRRLKHQKQLDFRVVGSAEFDEGADKNF